MRAPVRILALLVPALLGGATAALAQGGPANDNGLGVTAAPGQLKPKTDTGTTSATEAPVTATTPGEDAATATPVTGLAPLATPVAGQSAAVRPASGDVRVKLPGSDEYVDLSGASSVPMGATLDVTQGAVALTTSAPGGGTQTATFRNGAFSLAQHDGIAQLKLRGGDFSACKGGARAAAAHGRPKRRLWGSGHGRFRTIGRYSAATVRGTIWLTEDRCDGTLTVVKRGVVAVWDKARGKRVMVPAGHRYLAKAAPARTVTVGLGNFVGL